MKREAIQFERDSIGSPKKWKESPSPRLGSTPSGLDGSGTEGEEKFSNTDRLHNNSDRGVISRLMEMETRVNNEMSARYRSSVITSSRNASLDSLGGSNEIGGSSSAFSQPYRPCTVDDLNDISRTTLLLMVEWAKKICLRFLIWLWMIKLFC